MKKEIVPNQALLIWPQESLEIVYQCIYLCMVLWKRPELLSK